LARESIFHRALTAATPPYKGKEKLQPLVGEISWTPRSPGPREAWLCIWLRELGANVVGYALAPYTQKDNFVVSGLQQRMSHHLGDVR